MHIPMSKNSRCVSMAGKGVLLKRVLIKPLPLEISGGAILSNRILGITSNAVAIPPAPSATIASSMGGAIDFSKYLRAASKHVQRRKDKDENIKFVF